MHKLKMWMGCTSSVTNIVVSLINSVLTVWEFNLSFTKLMFLRNSTEVKPKTESDFKMYIVIYPDYLECIRNSEIIEGNIL